MTENSVFRSSRIGSGVLFYIFLESLLYPGGKSVLSIPQTVRFQVEINVPELSPPSWKSC